MEATELMCDDIVLHNGNAYKVFGVMGKANAVDLFPVHIRNAEGLLLGPIVCFAKYIEPIPLTPEILEMNGWDEEYHRFYDNDTYCELDLRMDNGGYVWINGGVVVCSIYYIHELQHALRLCGLNDLADNFKI